MEYILEPRKTDISDLPPEMIEHTMSFMEPQDMISFLMGMDYSIKEIKSFLTNKRIGKYRFLNIKKESEPLPHHIIKYYDEALDKDGYIILIDKGVKYIDKESFEFMTMESVLIPNSVTSIGNNAFANCESLKNVLIPNSVTSIGDNAFYDCVLLKNVKIPNSVTYIGSFAFYGCESLTSIVIPNGVNKIDSFTFGYCKSLINLVIPDSVTYIGVFAFKGCESLESVDIPDSVISMHINAFAECKSLTNLVIPDSVVLFEDDDFDREPSDDDFDRELYL